MNSDMKQVAKEIAVHLDINEVERGQQKLQDYVSKLDREGPNLEAAAFLRQAFLKTIKEYDQTGVGADLTLLKNSRGQVIDCTTNDAATTGREKEASVRTLLSDLEVASLPITIAAKIPPINSDGKNSSTEAKNHSVDEVMFGLKRVDGELNVNLTYVTRYMAAGTGLKAIVQANPNTKFEFSNPTFEAKPLVDVKVIDAMNRSARDAQGFLVEEHQRLSNKNVTSGSLVGYGARITEIENKLISLKPENLAKGNNALNPIGFSNFEAGTRGAVGFEKITAFETAQATLISQREIAMANLMKVERRAYVQSDMPKVRATLVNVGALSGALIGNYAVDKVIPRSDNSMITVVGDVTSPLVFGAKMAPFGKFAPVVKLGTVVGVHAFNRYMFDGNAHAETEQRPVKEEQN